MGLYLLCLYLLIISFGESDGRSHQFLILRRPACLMGGCSETPPLSANNEVGASVKPLLETEVGGSDRALDVEFVEGKLKIC
jgi:hypothetical protein